MDPCYYKEICNCRKNCRCPQNYTCCSESDQLTTRPTLGVCIKSDCICDTKRGLAITKKYKGESKKLKDSVHIVEKYKDSREICPQFILLLVLIVAVTCYYLARVI
jgi:hypothetical protein